MYRDLIVLLHNDLETSEDASKEHLHPHHATDLEKKTAKYNFKGWPSLYMSSGPLLNIIVKVLGMSVTAHEAVVFGDVLLRCFHVKF